MAVEFSCEIPEVNDIAKKLMGSLDQLDFDEQIKSESSRSRRNGAESRGNGLGDQAGNALSAASPLLNGMGAQNGMPTLGTDGSSASQGELSPLARGFANLADQETPGAPGSTGNALLDAASGNLSPLAQTGANLLGSQIGMPGLGSAALGAMNGDPSGLISGAGNMLGLPSDLTGGVSDLISSGDPSGLISAGANALGLPSDLTGGVTDLISSGDPSSLISAGANALGLPSGVGDAVGGLLNGDLSGAANLATDFATNMASKAIPGVGAVSAAADMVSNLPVVGDVVKDMPVVGDALKIASDPVGAVGDAVGGIFGGKDKDDDGGKG